MQKLVLDWNLVKDLIRVQVISNGQMFAPLGPGDCQDCYTDIHNDKDAWGLLFHKQEYEFKFDQFLLRKLVL